MTEPRIYPAGVPCWIDTEQPDPAATADFYRGLFGWEITNVAPPQAPEPYFVATFNGQDVAGIAPGTASSEPAWNTYIAVDDLSAATERVTGAGGRLTDEPVELGPPGGLAYCADPEGARFRLWRAGRRIGSQLVNVPNSWVFSHLRTGDLPTARAFYATACGWEFADMPGAMMWRRPGYGDHLAATVDPDIYTRQAGGPEGFADVVAGIEPLGESEAPHWRVAFLVADRERAVRTAQDLGGDVVSTWDTMWTRDAEIVDPQGARLTLSQFAPPPTIERARQDSNLRPED